MNAADFRGEPGFDRLAPHYRWLEAVVAGNLLQRCRVQWLPKVAAARQVLLVGEGAGRSLEPCAGRFPDAHFTVLDLSGGMLAAAKRRVPAGLPPASVHFVHADARRWRSESASFDLVITNFFLDCFNRTELADVVANLAQSASPEASWLVSDFCVPQNGWRRLRAQVLLRLAYAVFRSATGISASSIVDPEPLLANHGFQLQFRSTLNHGLLHSDLWSRAALPSRSKPAFDSRGLERKGSSA